VEREKFDTVGGLVFYLLGRIPGPGEEVACSGISLTVLSAAERRIGKLRAVRVIEPSPEGVQE
jgi:CBS domain containing-hemolysin-like protein